MISLRERLDELIDKSGGPDTCWPWLGTTNCSTRRHGGPYGRLCVGGVRRPAHARVLELHTGEPSNGRLALHTCDFTLCCNENHLYWGDQQQNVADREQRNRSNRRIGEDNGQSILTESQVREIRSRYIRYDKTCGQRALAREFGISGTAVWQVVHNQSWLRVET